MLPSHRTRIGRKVSVCSSLVYVRFVDWKPDLSIVSHIPPAMFPPRPYCLSRPYRSPSLTSFSREPIWRWLIRVMSGQLHSTTVTIWHTGEADSILLVDSTSSLGGIGCHTRACGLVSCGGHYWALIRTNIEIDVFSDDEEKIRRLEAQGFRFQCHFENKRTYDLATVDLDYTLDDRVYGAGVL